MSKGEGVLLQFLALVMVPTVFGAKALCRGLSSEVCLPETLGLMASPSAEMLKSVLTRNL